MRCDEQVAARMVTQRTFLPRATLRLRLTAVTIAGATLAAAAAVVAFNVVLASVLRRDVDRDLRARAAAVSTTVRDGPHGLHVRESPDDGALDVGVWVFDLHGAVMRARAGRREQRAARELARGGPRYRQLDGRARMYGLPIVVGGRRLGTVVTARSLDADDRTTDVAQAASAGLAATLLLGVLVATWVTLGRALAPVDAMTRSAADWGEHDLDRRFDVGTRDDELGRLGRTFDDLLSRVASSLRREQRLPSELSHELRTPLARIVTEVELLQRRPRSPEDRARAYARVLQSAEQMDEIIETLMAAARAEARGDRSRCELAPELRNLRERWVPAFAGRGIELIVRDDAAGSAGTDRQVLQRALSPVLDNALRHARTRVELGTSVHAGRVALSVVDDGPGVAPRDAERIFEPGVRGPEGRGAGLGLALARRLARAAGGDVRVETGRSGGAFVVELPT